MTQVTLGDGDEKAKLTAKAKSEDLPVSKRQQPEEDETKDGAPVTESPEQAAAPPEEAPRLEETRMETPESPAAAPMMHHPLGDIQSGGIRSGGSTYPNGNITNDPATMTAIDTGVATAPVDRPSTFTGATVVLSTANDYGVASTRAARPANFEPLQSATIYIALGAS